VIWVRFKKSAILGNWSSENVPVHNFYYLSRRIPRRDFMELYRAGALTPMDDPYCEITFRGTTVWIVDIEKAKSLGFEVIIEGGERHA